jgi:DNA replication and repair protein RecF
MDDIFEKLDEQRMIQLLDWVSHSTDGQVFITDTHKDRMDNLLRKYLADYQLIEL